MDRFFMVPILSMGLFLSACAWNSALNTQPLDTKTIPPVIIDDVKIMDPQTLYAQRQYDRALMAMLEAGPELLENLSARKLLWRINDRLVTVQWYLQKGITELLNGHKDKARYHINEVLKLYPDHKPSLLLKQNLDAIDLTETQKPSNIPPPLQEKEKIGNDPAKEDLKLAEYYLMTGEAYFEEGQLALAKRSWLRGLEIVPSHKTIKGKLVKLLTNEGLQLFGQGNIKASIEKWEEALKITPEDSETKGYLDKARKAEEKVRSID